MSPFKVVDRELLTDFRLADRGEVTEIKADAFTDAERIDLSERFAMVTWPGGKVSLARLQANDTQRAIKIANNDAGVPVYPFH